MSVEQRPGETCDQLKNSITVTNAFRYTGPRMQIISLYELLTLLAVFSISTATVCMSCATKQAVSVNYYAL